MKNRQIEKEDKKTERKRRKNRQIEKEDKKTERKRRTDRQRDTIGRLLLSK